MKKLIAMILAVLTLGTLVSCGRFNVDKEKEESREQLESLQDVFENEYEICSKDDVETFKSFVENNLTDYFTESFINNTNAQLGEFITMYCKYAWILYIHDEKVYYYNDYTITFDEIDSESETITYEIRSNEFLGGDDVAVKMVKEDGKWKVDSVS